MKQVLGIREPPDRSNHALKQESAWHVGDKMETPGSRGAWLLYRSLMGSADYWAPPKSCDWSPSESPSLW